MLAAGNGSVSPFILSWQRGDDDEGVLRHKEYSIMLKIPSFALGATVGLIMQVGSLAMNTCVSQVMNTGVVAALGLVWCFVACAATFAAARCFRMMIASQFLLSHTAFRKPLDLCNYTLEQETSLLNADGADPLERWFIAGALAGILLTAALTTL